MDAAWLLEDRERLPRLRARLASQADEDIRIITASDFQLVDIRGIERPLDPGWSSWRQPSPLRREDGGHAKSLIRECVQLVAHAEPHLLGSERLTWLARLEDTADQWRSALELALETGDAPALRLCLVMISLVRLNQSPFAALRRSGAGSLVHLVDRRSRGRSGPKIVAIGGGTGLSTLLRGLKEHTSNLTAIVTVADDGNSSGRLRRSLGIHPPGDFRQCIAARGTEDVALDRWPRHPRWTAGM